MNVPTSWTSIKNSSYYHFLMVAFLFTLLFLFYFKSILFSNVFITNDGTISDYFKVTPWTVDIFSGFPLASDAIFSAFYPLKFIIGKLIRLDFNFFIISGYFLMAFFTYSYVYHLTKFKTPALVSAIIYSFSGYAMTEIGHATHFIHTICWMPLILLSFEKLKEKFSLLWTLIGLLAIPTSIAAGFIQLSLPILLVLTSYALMISCQTHKILKQFSVFLAIIIGGCLIASPVLAPTFLLSQFTDRSHLSWEFFCSYYVELKQLLLFFFPNLMGGYYGIFQKPIFGNWEIVGNHGFVGFLSIILGMIGVWKCDFRLKPAAYFWLFFSFLTVIVALGPETPFYKLLYHIPIINNFRAPERYLFIFAFGMSVLAGFGMQAIQSGSIKTFSQKKIILIASFLFMCLLISSVVVLYPSLQEHALSKGIQLVKWLKNPAVVIPALWMAVSLVALCLLLKNPKNTLYNTILVATVCGEILFTAYFSYWHPANAWWSKEQFFHPPEYLTFLRDNLNASKQRFLKMGPANDTLGRYLWGDYPLYYHLPSAGGYTPLALKNYTDFLAIATHGAYTSAELHLNQAINIAGIKYLFTTANEPLNTLWFANKDQFKLRNVIGDTLVYENLQALPRVWFTHKLVVLSDEDMLQVIHTGKFADGTPFNPAHTALLKNPIGVGFSPDNTATAIIEKLNNNTVIISTQTKKPQFLMLSDIYYPGWKAYIDAKKSRFYLADYVYRGIVVPAGKHRIEFRYRPLYLYISYGITGTTLFILAGFFFYRYQRKKSGMR